MSNDVQSHESVVERLPGEERRASPRHAASTLGSVTARIIGGSPVDLVNFSARGVLFECDSRLLIGARASVRITTNDANLIVSGRVVRSRVKGLVNGALRYDAALALDHELTLRPMLVASDAATGAVDHANGSDDDAGDVRFEPELDASFDPAPVEAYLAASEASLAEAAGQGDPEAEAIALFEGTPVDGAVSDPGPANGEAADLHVEVSVRATLEEAQAAAPALHETEAASEGVPEAAADDEPIAFEADAEIAFEAADEFVFEDAFQPAAAPDADAVETPPAIPAGPAHEAAAATAIEGEPASESMFDATPFVPPTDDTGDGVSMFDATPPMAVAAGSASSVFDARPSATWRGTDTGEPAAEAAAAAVAGAEAESVDFETDVAFEADDAVLFESVFEAEPSPAGDAGSPAPEAESIAPEAEPTPVEPEPMLVAEVAVAGPVGEYAAADTPEPPEATLGRTASDDQPAASDDDERALLPFTSTVPVDLADLRRIAADNQW